MLVVLAVAALAILGGVVVVAMGGGGRLAPVHPDVPPSSLPTGRPITGTDAALLVLPRGIWGYHVQVTDDALRRIAYALAERDARVAALEQQVAELRSQARAAERTQWSEAAETPWEPAGDEYLQPEEPVLEEQPGKEIR